MSVRHPQDDGSASFLNFLRIAGFRNGALFGIGMLVGYAVARFLL